MCRKVWIALLLVGSVGIFCSSCENSNANTQHRSETFQTTIEEIIDVNSKSSTERNESCLSEKTNIGSIENATNETTGPFDNTCETVDLSEANIERVTVNVDNGTDIEYERYLLPDYSEFRVYVYDRNKNLLQVRSTNYAEKIEASLEIDVPKEQNEVFSEMWGELRGRIRNADEFSVTGESVKTMNQKTCAYVWEMARSISMFVNDTVYFETTLDGELLLLNVGYAAIENLTDDQIDKAGRLLEDEILRLKIEDNYEIVRQTANNYDGQIVMHYVLRFMDNGGGIYLREFNFLLTPMTVEEAQQIAIEYGTAQYGQVQADETKPGELIEDEGLTLWKISLVRMPENEALTVYVDAYSTDVMEK